ncbi:3-oxoacyl-[acyl-carrier-protein] synthase [Phytophthora rubi]|uniref:3-oxoacyl-[acyl-carrier-protein] synthase n=1 Tax=Phytophthora rubi TaxID=129364 RepID=A0A6A3NSF0_9STRA|nr:3-oxoacyl-[acyl-carrier-protein] synthase [Phytophthora rubi]KAE9048483.1 3-oxoacyl-[acyl-carrier-protein] synthase [Phytophthora rubi]KAE9353216.1 3-oxoacyl-[acyl-carrier-protein] synthase [Phytophthora rubi]
MMLAVRREAALARSLSTLSFAPPPPVPPRRVVVTGLGAVTPFGVGVARAWEKVLDSQCAIQSLDMLLNSGLNCTVGATVPRGDEEGAFHTAEWTNPKSFRAQEVDHVAMALAAADEAIKDSGWTPESDEERERAGVAIGAACGNIQEVMDVGQLIKEKKFRRVTPFFVPRILINLAAGHVSIEHGLRGPVHSCVTACATGSHSIGDAARFIQHGDADVMVAGGTEPSINEMAICAFDRPRALSTKYNDRPKEASRPFDSKRDGFVMGEGAGVVVLEEYEHAKKRGARIYAEVRGYGLSGDGSHITAPLGNGDGARRAMQSAIAQSGLALSDIGYVNAHAAGTPLGDRAENNAIKTLFGDDANKLGVSSTKGSIGHLQGSAGAVEAIFAIKALQHNVMPPTLNLTETTEEFTLNYVPNQPQEKELHAVMSNSFGFGGTNASLLFAM